MLFIRRQAIVLCVTVTRFILAMKFCSSVGNAWLRPSSLYLLLPVLRDAEIAAGLPDNAARGTSTTLLSQPSRVLFFGLLDIADVEVNQDLPPRHSGYFVRLDRNSCRLKKSMRPTR
jgi:hypothetical protein